MSETEYALVIGNKNYSSWSLRPWLAMRKFEIPFTEIRVDIYSSGKRERILKHSPSALVPVLKAGECVIWDSLAILETLADMHPDHAFWPARPEARALARSVSAEMHSGFAALRNEMPMDFVHEKPLDEVSEAVQRDITRIFEIWQMCRSAFGGSGPYLFSDFTIADAMYAPVASRLRTYTRDLSGFGDDGTAFAYIETIFAMPEIVEWADGARAELAGQTTG